MKMADTRFVSVDLDSFILRNSDPEKTQICDKQVIIIGRRRYQFCRFRDDIKCPLFAALTRDIYDIVLKR